MISLLQKFIKSKLSGYAFIGLAVLVAAFTVGVSLGVVRLCDERCEGLVSIDKVTDLEKQLAAVRASQAKRTAIRNEVRNATDEKLDSTAARLGILRDD